MKLLLVFLVLVSLLLLYEVARIGLAYMRAQPALQSTKPYERVSGSPAVLVVGDSTGFGTGASAPEESVAGRLGAFMPTVALENRSKNGMKIGGALTVMKSLAEDVRYELILLQIGGNDVMYFSAREAARAQLRALFAEAAKHSDRVFFMSSGDVGNAPAFGPLLSFVMSARTLDFRDMFMEEALRADVQYVDLYEEREKDPFVREPWVYHSADGLHPSSAGYGLWFEKLKANL